MRTWWKGRPRIVLLLLEEVKTCVTEEAYGMNETLSDLHSNAVLQGKAVVDGGATKTLGSVMALEKV